MKDGSQAASGKYAGIDLEALDSIGSQHNEIENNTILQTSSTRYQYGISLDSGSGYNTIKTNDLSGYDAGAISIASADNMIN